MGPRTWMTSCPEALGILEFEKKKTVSWDLNSERVSWDLGLDEESRFSELAERRPVKIYEICRAFVESVSRELTMYEQSA